MRQRGTFKKSSNLLMFFLLFSFGLKAQEITINKEWIWNSRVNCEGEKLASEERAKWNVEFTENLQAIISKNRSDTKGKSTYTIDKNEIVMNGTTYSINKLAKDSLVLGLKECEKLVFISRKLLLEKQKKNYFIHQGDTIYFSTDFNAPKMTQYANYMDYMRSKLPGIDYYGGNCSIKLQFIVRKDGSLSNARGNISCHKRKSDKSIEKLMSEMAGQWIPMYLDQKAVSTLMRINIEHSGTVIKAKDLSR